MTSFKSATAGNAQCSKARSCRYCFVFVGIGGGLKVSSTSSVEDVSDSVGEGAGSRCGGRGSAHNSSDGGVTGGYIVFLYLLLLHCY